MDDLQILTLKTNYASAGMVAHALNPSTWKEEAGESEGQTELHNIKITKSRIYMRLLYVYL